jgi:hypothetical protein
MSYIEDYELARQRLLQADRALNEYLRHSPYNFAQETQLAGSVESARNEFLASVTFGLPEIILRPFWLGAA